MLRWPGPAELPNKADEDDVQSTRRLVEHVRLIKMVPGTKNVPSSLSVDWPGPVQSSAVHMQRSAAWGCCNVDVDFDGERKLI